MKLQVKRIYEDFSKNDGLRVLADRLWPSGITKEKAKIDLWAKDITPTNELRKWFHVNRDLYAEFKTRYLSELRTNVDFEDFLNDIRDHDSVTFLTSAKNVEHSHIPVLYDFIEQKLK